MKQYITLKQFQDTMCVGKRTSYEMVHSKEYGKFFVQLGRKWLCDIEAFQKHLETQKSA